MDGLAVLLRSRDRETQSRALKLFHSCCVTDPSQVFSKFPVFLPYFMYLLENRASGSIAFFEETENLIRGIVGEKVAMGKEAVDALLSYFLACFVASRQNCTVDAYVAHIFDNSHIPPAIKALFERVDVSAHVGMLFKVAAASENQEILELIKQKAKEIGTLISANPQSFIDAIIRGIQSLDKDVSEFTAEVVLQAISSKELLDLLVPYTSYVQGRSNVNKSETMKQVFQAVQAHLVSENIEPRPIECSGVPLAMILTDREKFSKGHGSGEGQTFMSEKARSRTMMVPQTAMGLSKKLEAPAPSSSTAATAAATATNVPVQRSPSQRGMSVAKKDANEALATFGHKLGGFQHGTWQQRYFQFFPTSKCLVWRAKKTAGEVKGIIVIDQHAKLEKVPKGIKGRPFVLQIKLPKKVHEISFSGQEELDRWANAIEECRNIK